MQSDRQVRNRILPTTVDECLRQENLTLPQIRRVIPQKYLRPDPLRSWWELVRVLGCMTVCLYLLSLVRLGEAKELMWQVPALVSLWILYGWVLVGLFVIGHDCGHYSFSRRKWVNDLVGYLCMSPLANSFQSWRLTHNHHHVHTQLRGQEVDWATNLVTREEFKSLKWKQSFMTRLGYCLPFGMFLWITWNTVRRGVMVRTLLTRNQSAKKGRKLLWSNAIMLISLLAIYGGLGYFYGLWGMLKYHGIPATIAMLSGGLIITIQHANQHSLLYEKSGWTSVRGQLASTFDVRFPAWMEYLWCHINIHIPHHISPVIPWYYLKEVSQHIQAAYADYYQEQNFSLGHLTWFYRTPFLKRIDGKGYYILELAEKEGLLA